MTNTAPPVIHNLLRKGWLSRLVGGPLHVLAPRTRP
jgi:hypothetical protein